MLTLLFINSVAIIKIIKTISQNSKRCTENRMLFFYLEFQPKHKSHSQNSL
ncbi:hypothetical protein LEP1GSC193_3858 [Leptospira alstonii serovar Pingchang str. 80-412]|uniref:Uncharacterized protein n=1 Tax=Leptospira alstonii serovar Pingchang str. 80-412 TaxID=1218564 RepID=T0G343_9LEPT|nr:hypothetical protein LEP1GSC193_3858 [Leptospira alstonii serovar Pingchang str. 80-412]